MKTSKFPDEHRFTINYLKSIHKVPFLFSSCPKLVIGHPELAKKTGFPIKDFGNDRQTNRVYGQELIIE
jgi:hypothetical protein